MKRTLLLTFAALVLTASAGHGQMKVQFDLGGGISEPTGDYGDFTDLGWHGLATVAVVPNGSPLAIQVTGFYSQLDFKTIGGRWELGGGFGELRLDLLKRSKMTGSVLLGGGVIHAKAKPDVGGSTSDTRGAFDGGLGLTYNVTEMVGFFFQARYVNIFIDGPDITMIPLTAGLRFHFR